MKHMVNYKFLTKLIFNCMVLELSKHSQESQWQNCPVSFGSPIWPTLPPAQALEGRGIYAQSASLKGGQWPSVAACVHITAWMSHRQAQADVSMCICQVSFLKMFQIGSATRKIYIRKKLEFQFFLNFTSLHGTEPESQFPSASFHAIHLSAWTLQALTFTTDESHRSLRHQGLGTWLLNIKSPKKPTPSALIVTFKCSKNPKFLHDSFGR